MQTVGQVAAATGVSVRTLHHWEQVGLVVPAARRANGYRAYGDAEVARDLEQRMAEAMAGGEDGCALAEEHRQLMTRWFHDVSPQMHVQLAEMYVGDERFTAHYDRRAPGLARWLRNAIVDAHGGP